MDCFKKLTPLVILGLLVCNSLSAAGGTKAFFENLNGFSGTRYSVGVEALYTIGKGCRGITYVKL